MALVGVKTKCTTYGNITESCFTLTIKKDLSNVVAIGVHDCFEMFQIVIITFRIIKWEKKQTYA